MSVPGINPFKRRQPEAMLVDLIQDAVVIRSGVPIRLGAEVQESQLGIPNRFASVGFG
jgi:hypothetical protein